MLRSTAAAVALMAACLTLTPDAVFAQESATARYIRTEAPEPYAPAGPLHFLGLTPFVEGVFVDPASIRRTDNGVEVRLLTVGSEVRRVVEGDIRWTWSRLNMNCPGRSWDTLELDSYDTAGTWLAGFVGPVLPTNPVDGPSEETVLAYVCGGVRPAQFQVASDQAEAVSGIIQAFSVPAGGRP